MVGRSKSVSEVTYEAHQLTECFLGELKAVSAKLFATTAGACLRMSLLCPVLLCKRCKRLDGDFSKASSY